MKSEDDFNAALQRAAATLDTDLVELCCEVLAWRSSGTLPDEAKLRSLAAEARFQRFGDEAIRQAETAVMLKACKIVAESV